MGTPADPDEPIYEGGDSCSTCESSTFFGKTPKFVRATFEGITNCPGFPVPDADRSFVLMQDPLNACVFGVRARQGSLTWDVLLQLASFDPGPVSFLNLSGDGAPYFESKPDGHCQLSYTNEHTCGGGQPFVEGSGSITFGPDANQDTYDAQFP